MTQRNVATGQHLTNHAVLAVTLFLLACTAAFGQRARFTIPYVTGRPGTQAFAGHPGWVDAYSPGPAEGVFARVQDDATFELPKPTSDKHVVYIAMFDKIETPPVIITRGPSEHNDHDFRIAVEYACAPEGYPATWDQQYKTRATNFFQTITPRGTQLYGVSFFDGPRMLPNGNQSHVSFHEGGPDTPAMQLKDAAGPDPVVPIPWDFVTTARSDHELPRAGWRHGNVETTPGKPCTIEVSGYRSHSGKNYELDAFVRPDKGDGYAGGEAFADKRPTGGDLCCLIFGNSHGQLVENQTRSEEWELFLPRHRPSTEWGQSFTSHGVSLAGVSFWASTGDSEPLTCEIRIHEEGPWGKAHKAAKIARGHESPHRPFVRFPRMPKARPGSEAFATARAQLLQAAWMPDEVPLKAGKTYYVELIPSRPVLVYADGDYYQHGFAYYEGLKVDRQITNFATLHSTRWTLAMNIVTYANPGGKPLNGAVMAEKH